MERKFLEELGIAKETIDKVLDANMAEIGKHKQAAEKLTAERDGLTAQLADANKAVEGFKGLDVDGIKAKAAEWEQKYNADTGALQAQLAAKDYERSVHAQAAALKFSSESARKAFVADLTAAKLSMQDGTLLGFEDFRKRYAEADPAAFAQNTPPPAIVRPATDAAPTTITKEAFGKMGYSQRSNLQRTQPELYKQLKEGV